MSLKGINYSNSQVSFLVILRVLIGWHFLYEGIAKLLNPNWTSIGYIMDSQGFFSQFFYSIGGNHSMVSVIDVLNVYGLIAIGLGLIAGCLTQMASFFGIVLLAFYYLSHPPLVGVKYALPSEGSYLFVNKTLIELFAMLVLMVFPTGRIVGIDRLIFGRKPVESQQTVV